MIDQKLIKRHTEEYTPKNVLIIGNGFDLAHGLLTSYSHFLQLIKNPDDFLRYYNHKIGVSTIGAFENNTCWEKYLSLVDESDKDKIWELVSILKNNSWANYYANCNAEIDGWVDFEQEMIPVIRMFNKIISSGSLNKGLGHKNYAYMQIDDIGIGRIAKLWPKYIKDTSICNSGQEITLTVESEYSDQQYGVLHTKLLKDLKEDLDEFVSAFCMYLELFVERCKKVKHDPFETMEVAYILNFNYTSTIFMYENLMRGELVYLHGSLVNKGPVKMILGVNNVEDDAEYRFKEFEKRYQRICNSTNQSYKKIIKEGNYNLIIYGHSLDVTDKSILEPLIRNAHKTEIYCHNDINIKKKNLMLLLGDDDAEEMLHNGIIELLN